MKTNSCFGFQNVRPVAFAALLALPVLLAPAARTATNDLTGMLQTGLFEEEANHNLNAAIQAYQSVASQFDKDRKLAATAIFRLGECYRKQGVTNDAVVQYQRILRDFSDQQTLVTLSQQNLSAMGGAPVIPAVTALAADAARQEQKRLLGEEIKLAEKALAMQQSRVDVGKGTPEDLLQAQRDLLVLKRQLAALDAGSPPSATGYIYRVQSGDTLSGIVAAYREKGIEVTMEQIRGANPGLDSSRLLVGSKIFIPAPGGTARLSTSTPEGAAAPTTTEAEEVKRIQALIKDSPDLINAKRDGRTPLQAAAEQGQLVVARFLLESGADVEARDSSSQTPLHAAVSAGHKSMVELLLSFKASVSALDNRDNTPLHLAAMNGYRSVAEVLLAHGADLNGNGITPLHWAAAKGFKSVAELLLDHGANPNICASDNQPIYGTPLHAAAFRGDVAVAALLLTHGANVNALNNGGRTPLSYAIGSAAALPTMQALLAARADPNAGRTGLPLALAAYFGNTPAMGLLLTNGANPNLSAPVQPGDLNQQRPGESFTLRPGESFTPLYLAVYRRHPEAVKLLSQFKADLNAPEHWGDPPIFTALSDTNTLQALLDSGADANRENSAGESPLGVAARDSNLSAAAQLLLDHGAQARSAETRTGSTPLFFVAIIGPLNLAELLIKHGADVNAQGPSGDTPLHAAARNGRHEMVELLLENKADPNIQNKAGDSPLNLARRSPPPTPQPMPIGVPVERSDVQSRAKLLELLEQHGALAELPRPDYIQVRRPASGFSALPLSKGTNDWNHLTLLEVLAVQFEYLAASPAEVSGPNASRNELADRQAKALPFPDLTRISVRRLAPDRKSWQEQTVNLETILQSTNGAGDVSVNWGDVVEVPEMDHPMNDRWRGFSDSELEGLRRCLSRQVEVIVKGRATNIVLAPRIRHFVPRLGGLQSLEDWSVVTKTPFWLRPALLNSGVLMASSDLSRVKVTRLDAVTGKTLEWVFDCRESQPAPELWLRNGDVIEVPEKP